MDLGLIVIVIVFVVITAVDILIAIIKMSAVDYWG
jgi:hypothetical protein